MDPTYPLFPILNLLSCVLVLLPILIKLRHTWNTGVHFLAIWVSAESFALGVNAIIWSDNTNDVAPVWCDISEHCQTAIISSSLLTRLIQASHLFIGAYIAKPACSLVITRRLYRIISLQHTNAAPESQVCSQIAPFDYDSHTSYKPGAPRSDIRYRYLCCFSGPHYGPL